MRNTFLALVGTLMLGAVLVAGAVAGEAVFGRVDGHRLGLRLEPGAESRRRVAHRPEGRGQCGSRGRVPRRRADRTSTAAAISAATIAMRGQRDRQPGVLGDEHVPLHAPSGRVRAGDGVLLDHGGAEVRAQPRLRRDASPRDRQRVAARAHRPVGRRQLVHDGSSDERDPLRQGRRRRRRGRRGDPARVRPCAAPGAELLVRLGAGRRDQRGLRRLLGGHGDRRRAEEARRPGEGAASVRRRLGLDLVHLGRPALSPADRREPPLPGRPRRRGASTTARSGRARCGTSARASAT